MIISIINPLPQKLESVSHFMLALCIVLTVCQAALSVSVLDKEAGILMQVSLLSLQQNKPKYIIRNVVLQPHIVYKTMFYYVSVYTIRGTDIPYVSSYYMFRSDGAILRYIRIHIYLFLLLVLLPHWLAFTHWECVVCMVLHDALCAKRIEYLKY
jgi:hypothetical protein